MTVILNPAPAAVALGAGRAALLSAADVITPNRVEALMLAGIRCSGGGPNLLACCPAAARAGAAGGRDHAGAGGLPVVPGTRIRERPVAVRSRRSTRSGPATRSTAPWPWRWPRAVRSSRPRPGPCAAAALAVTKPGAQSALPYRDEIDHLAAGSRSRPHRDTAGATEMNMSIPRLDPGPGCWPSPGALAVAWRASDARLGAPTARTGRCTRRARR